MSTTAAPPDAGSPGARTAFTATASGPAGSFTPGSSVQGEPIFGSRGSGSTGPIPVVPSQHGQAPSGSATGSSAGLAAGPVSATAITVDIAGTIYPAEPVARGAAFEIFSAAPGEGFLPNPRQGAPFPYRRFVHISEVEVVGGPAPAMSDTPLAMPVGRSMSWTGAYRLAQSGGPRGTAMRRTATIVPGTRMMKVLSARQLSGYLRGLLPHGFCYRECDIAHLRTPAELSVLRTDTESGDDRVMFALRWRAVSAADYAIPFGDTYPGLVSMPPRDRVGPLVLGSGFAPSRHHIVPEFVTADFADLPLPAHAELLAFTDDGAEILLYRYIAEQRTWGRLAGRQWRHLFDHVEGVVPDQEYFAIPPAPTSLIGNYGGQEYEALADPPDEFVLLAKVRALRHAVTDPARRLPVVRWRDVTCALVRDTGDWLRLRLMRPDPETVERTGAACAERGVYEVWAPAAEAGDRSDLIIRYGV